MTCPDFILMFAVNYGIGVGVWSFMSKRLIWYDPLFIVIVHLSLYVTASIFIKSPVWRELLSIVLTIFLYVRVFLPITYPIKRVTHEPINNKTNDQ